MFSSEITELSITREKASASPAQDHCVHRAAHHEQNNERRQGR